MVLTIVGIVIIVAFACAVAGIYNNMLTLRNRIDDTWKTIDAQLQRRNDLIPGLIETVKAYAPQETQALETLAEARETAVAATAPDKKMAADNTLSAAVRQVLDNAEGYPALKANTNFMQLRSSLEDAENKISYARQSYNDCVLRYNSSLKSFPNRFFAVAFQFKERSSFDSIRS